MLASELETVLVINNTLNSNSKHNAGSVFGGPYRIAVDRTIKRGGVDAVCVDKGEIFFYEILQSFRAREAFWAASNFLANQLEKWGF